MTIFFLIATIVIKDLFFYMKIINFLKSISIKISALVRKKLFEILPDTFLKEPAVPKGIFS